MPASQSHDYFVIDFAVR